MITNTPLDSDLETFRSSLHAIDDEKIYEVQKKRNRRTLGKLVDGEYNYPRMLNALAENNLNRAPYEKMVSDRIAEQVGRQPHNGFLFVPVERRDLTAASAASAGYLVGSDAGPGGLFVHFLDESLRLDQLGVRRVTLQRPSVIPAITTTISTSWLQTEGSTLSQDNFAFAIKAVSPKTVGSYCQVSRLLMTQAAIDGMPFLMQAQARATAAEVRRKLLSGSGASGEIDGVIGSAGVHSIAGASNTLPTYLNAIEDIETSAAILNEATMGIVVSVDVAREARGREVAAGSGMLMQRNSLAGYPAHVSSGLAANTAIVGDWSQLVLVEFSILEVGADPYGSDGALFKKGLTGLRTLWSVDSVLLSAESFCELTGLN